ncbi:MAG TPA: hypothetical protein P5277_01855 [Candidatus Paceibacterota bacterium]|nr:hypothetical protein [Candidatus Paceibacterota bacterium]
MESKNLVYKTAYISKDEQEAVINSERADIIDSRDGFSYIVLDPNNIYLIVKRKRKNLLVSNITSISLIEKVLEDYEEAILDNCIH